MYETSDQGILAYLIYLTDQGQIRLVNQRKDSGGRIWLGFEPAKEAESAVYEYINGNVSVKPRKLLDAYRILKSILRQSI